jgi:UDP-2,3-diacylglucosamine pyrophosphatase LpxH
MTLSFDLISDLHVDTWKTFDWTGQATSPYCVVAGDVGRDPATMEDTLRHLGQCYQAVFYIDGNDEHRFQLDNLDQSYQDITACIQSIPNVVFMQNHTVIINGVALLATNGWWTYDFDPAVKSDAVMTWLQDRYGISQLATKDIANRAWHDAAYLVRSVRQLQKHQEVRAIAVITHTVPAAWIVKHDLDLDSEYRFNTMGNSLIDMALDEDTEHKIRVWCFGHYHKGVDRERNGIRYVNNCRGRGDTAWCQQAYYPKRITVEF